jgi:ABC-type Mn2+/Zn2+ transport system permease subunit
VIPAAAGLQMASNFRKAMILSVLAAVFSVSVGLYLAFIWDLPASGTIVSLSFLMFIVSFPFRKRIT